MVVREQASLPWAGWDSRDSNLSGVSLRCRPEAAQPPHPRHGKPPPDHADRVFASKEVVEAIRFTCL